MPILAITRLKLKSLSMMPKFLFENEAAVKQIRIAKGFLTGKTLAEPNRGMWSATLWDNEENMRNYYTTAAHLALMPKLVEYACEAATTHIPYPGDTLPSWSFCHEQLMEKGRFADVLNQPTDDHINQFISAPKVTFFTRPLKPKK